MFTTTDQFGVCPYDGFYIYAYELPRPEFIQQHRAQIRTQQPPDRAPFRPGTTRQALWRRALFLPIAGQKNALKVMWEPFVPVSPWSSRPMPLTRVYVNPSTTGYDAQQTYELLLTILPDPLSALMAMLDTKVDVQAPYWQVAGHIYYPYARFVGHADWLPAAGTIYEGKWTRVSIYAKGGDHDQWDRLRCERMYEDPVPPATRVEVRQRFVKPRPTVGDFLRGHLVDNNKLRQLRVVDDLDGLGDRLLADEAQARGGLTWAVREYRKLANVAADDIQVMKERINAVASREIFDLYRTQAAA